MRRKYIKQSTYESRENPDVSEELSLKNWLKMYEHPRQFSAVTKPQPQRIIEK